jgi:hypothetical protein
MSSLVTGSNDALARYQTEAMPAMPSANKKRKALFIEAVPLKQMKIA